MSSPVSDLETLARNDPTVAPLALLQAVAVEAANDPAWASSAGTATILAAPGCREDRGGPRTAEERAPLLHGLTLTVDAGRQRALLHRLAAPLAGSGPPEDRALDALFGAADFDPLALLTASVRQDVASVEAIAARAGADTAVLAVVGHAATLPLLLACARRAEHTIESTSWKHGYCPLCAAWPTLAEIRGLARDFVLRCGRCASGWRFVQRGCAFCGNQDQQSQGYFAAEQERETRRASVCDACHGYLKMVTTLGPLSISELMLRDLQSLELDVTAIEHGYARPDRPAWDLDVRIEPMAARDTRARGGWQRFWR